MATFTWVGGADIDGPNNWTTPANWVSGGVAATTFPNTAADLALVFSDIGASDAIISNGQAITVADLAVGNASAPGDPGGHVIVGGSPAIGGGGGGSLTSVGPIALTSTNSGGALVGGLNTVITAPSITLSAPGVVMGGGGTYNIPIILNNGTIQADGGFYGLGPVILNATTITGTGVIEVDGTSTVEINAPTSENIQVAVATGQTATIILDQPGAFTGGINLLTPDSAVNVFFKGQSPTGVSYNANNQTLVITGAGGATIDTIPFLSNGTVALGAVTSTLTGYGEIHLGPSLGVLPGIPAPVNGISTTTLSSTDLSALLQGDQSAMRFVAGTEAVTLVDGTLSVGPDTNEAYVTRLYEGLLGRGPDINGLSAWNSALNSGMSNSDLAQIFVSSPEFQTAHPNQDNATFVATLYQNVLGRTADTDGLNSWTGQLAAGMSRGTLASIFVDSPEAKTHWAGVTSSGEFAYNPNSAVVREDYLTAFGRDTDTSGLAYWTNQLQNGLTATQFAQIMASSPEFQSLHGSQSDAAYVTSLYVNGLGRQPDQAGLNAWVGALESGTSRATLVGVFAQSPESQSHLTWALTAGGPSV